MLGSELNKTSKQQPPPTVLSQFERLAESARTLQERIGEDQTPDGKSLKTILAKFQALEDKIKNGGMLGKLAALNILTELVTLLENEMDRETPNQHSLFNEMLRFLVTLDLRSVPENANLQYPETIVRAAKKLRIIIDKAEKKLLNDVQEHRGTFLEPSLTERDTLIAVDTLFPPLNAIHDEVEHKYREAWEKRLELIEANKTLDNDAAAIEHDIKNFKTPEKELEDFKCDINQLEQQESLLNILNSLGYVEAVSVDESLKSDIFSTFSPEFKDAMRAYVAPVASLLDDVISYFWPKPNQPTPAYQFFYAEFTKEIKKPEEELKKIRRKQLENNKQIGACYQILHDIAGQKKEIEAEIKKSDWEKQMETSKMAIFKAIATTFLTAELKRMDTALGATWLNYQDKNKKKEQLQHLLHKLSDDKKVIKLNEFIYNIRSAVAANRNASDVLKSKKTTGSGKFEEWFKNGVQGVVFAIEEIQRLNYEAVLPENKVDTLTRLTDAAIKESGSAPAEKIDLIVEGFYSEQLRKTKNLKDVSSEFSEFIKKIENYILAVKPENLTQQKEICGKILAYTTCIVNITESQLVDPKQSKMIDTMYQNYAKLCMEPVVPEIIKTAMLTVYNSYKKTKDPTSVADMARSMSDNNDEENSSQQARFGVSYRN